MKAALMGRGAFIYLILVTMPLGINACLNGVEFIL